MSENQSTPSSGLRILLPLDGSKAAEEAITIAEYLGTHTHVSVLLLHALEAGARPSVHGERHLTGKEEANRYLQEMQQRLAARGVAATCHVHAEGIIDVAHSIVQHASEINPSFILMVMHGHGTFHGFWHGGIAQKAFNLGSWPILFIPSSCTPGELSFRRILLPVDGFHDPDATLSLLAPIAQATGALVHLMVAVPPPQSAAGGSLIGRFLPIAAKAVHDAATQGAARYLKGIEGRWSDRLQLGLEVRNGEAGEQILQAAEQADLICLTSHGQAGWAAQMEGSIGQRLVQKARRPLMLVRAAKAPTP